MKEKIKEYLLELCCAYTFVSVTGAIVNIIAGTETNNINVLVMFLTCTIATFVLFLHKLFDNISPLAMMIIQYLIASGLIAIMPYIILAGFYYYRVFSETKAQNALIKELQSQIEE